MLAPLQALFKGYGGQLIQASGNCFVLNTNMAPNPMGLSSLHSRACRVVRVSGSLELNPAPAAAAVAHVFQVMGPQSLSLLRHCWQQLQP